MGQVKTFKEIGDHIETVCRETQIDSTIDNFINQVLAEINDPSWAFEQVRAMRGYNHLWSFNRRKTTLTATAETAQLPRDLDKIGLIRQTSSPSKLKYLPDEVFYRYVPNPTATGNPLFHEQKIKARFPWVKIH